MPMVSKSDAAKSPESQIPKPKSGETFPRGQGLPTQTPLFWVGQKDRYLRQLLIKDIEAITGRGLIVYFSDCDTTAKIDGLDVQYLTELLDRSDAREYDILLETNGGFTDAAENVVSTLKLWGKPFRAIVPLRAKSNGTLIALAAQSILMGATSELGPIDPSINNMPCTFIENIAAAGQPVDPMLLQFAQHANKQTRDLAYRLLESGMLAAKDKSEIEDVVNKLASRDVYHSHGSVIDYSEAHSLGLAVEFLGPDDELWKRLWLLRCMFAFDAKTTSVQKIFESANTSNSLTYPTAQPAPTAP